MKFNIHDWLEALNSLIETKEFIKAEKTGKDNLSRFPDSSHLHLLVGKAFEGQDKITDAKIYFKKAMELDKDNLEAVEKSK
jgi:tetratricopeptide (TPR) repeat protein